MCRPDTHAFDLATKPFSDSLLAGHALNLNFLRNRLNRTFYKTTKNNMSQHYFSNSLLRPDVYEVSKRWKGWVGVNSAVSVSAAQNSSSIRATLSRIARV